MRVDWLPDVLRDAGLNVDVMPGALTRGRSMRSVQGVVGHHTATGPNWNDDHVAFLLRDGRRDLAGPLSQLGLERDGTFVVIATGKSNHNGYGEWGNDSIGIEAYNSGIGEPWPRAQYEAYVRGAAAVLARLGFGEHRFKGHRETDPRRKPDPRGIDLDQFRRDIVTGFAPASVPRPPEPPPVRARKADSMLIRSEGYGLFLITPAGIVVALTPAEFTKSQSGGVPVAELSPDSARIALGR